MLASVWPAPSTHHGVGPIKMRDALTYGRVMSQFIKEPLGRDLLGCINLLELEQFVFFHWAIQCGYGSL